MLSDPAGLAEVWSLVEVPGLDPGVLRSDGHAERRYRLRDAGGAPAAGVEVRLAPLGRVFTTDAEGVVTLDLDVQALAPTASGASPIASRP